MPSPGGPRAPRARARRAARSRGSRSSSRAPRQSHACAASQGGRRARPPWRRRPRGSSAACLSEPTLGVPVGSVKRTLYSFRLRRRLLAISAALQSSFEGVLLLAGLPLGARAARAAEPADLLLTNGVVHTVDASRPRAEAVAVKGARIVAVGTSAELRAYRGPGTRVIDLGGRTLVPGFEDAHAHFLGIGFARLDVDLVGTASYAEVVARVAQAVQGPAPGRMGLRPRLARGEVDGAGARCRARLPDPSGAVGRLPRQPRDPLARGRPRRAGERPGDGALRHLGRDPGPRGRRDHPRRERRAHGRVRRRRQEARHPAGARRARAAACDRARHGRVPRQGDHEPRRCGRAGRDDRALQGAGRGRQASHAALRDGGRLADAAGPRADPCRVSAAGGSTSAP